MDLGGLRRKYYLSAFCRLMLWLALAHEKALFRANMVTVYCLTRED